MELLYRCRSCRHKIEETELAFGRLTEEYNQPKRGYERDYPVFSDGKADLGSGDVFIKKGYHIQDKRVEIEWNYAFGEEQTPAKQLGY